jgi:high-affinity iron transporter
MGLASVRVARAQDDHPAQRLSSIVGVAVGEYAKGVDERGKLISAEEHSEATGFLRDASEVAGRLPGKNAEAARAILDTLIVAADADRPPHEITAIYRRFAAALGSEGALELPANGVDAAAGAALYQQTCATCHGAAGKGDGPAAKSLSTVPPAIGTAAEMHGVSPALMYRIVSVGVRGTAMPAWTAMTPSQRWNVVAYVTSLRATPAQVHAGEGLYFQRCASCHGATGAGGGAYARELTTLPPEIGRLAWQAERSDSQLAEAIVHGVPASAMPPARDLSAADVASLVAYIRSLPGKAGQSVALVPTSAVPPADSTSAAGIAAHVMALVNEALVDARGGRMSDAEDRAFDSYIAFEPLETPARAKNPGLVSALERQFADFKGAIKISDLRVADRARDAIQLGLPEIIQLTQPTGGGWSAFLQSFLIILREGFEAILVVGAVVAFLLKTGHRDTLPAIWKGTALGLLASGVTAVILATVLRALPASQEILEGATLLVAVAVLFSVSYWLISKVEAARWQQFIREKVNSALAHGGGKALALVAFLAVYREGAETALFYQALFNEGGHTAVPLTLGIIVGFVALGIIFTLFYRFGVRIPLRPFFTVTSALLYYMAFVFAGKGVRELQEGGAVPITLLSGFPHIELMGIFPSVETLLAQFVLIALLVFGLAKTFWPKRSVTLPTVPAGATANGAAAPVPRVVPAGDIDQRLGAIQAAIDALNRRVVAMEERAGTRE